MTPCLPHQHSNTHCHWPRHGGFLGCGQGGWTVDLDSAGFRPQDALGLPACTTPCLTAVASHPQLRWRAKHLCPTTWQPAPARLPYPPRAGNAPPHPAHHLGGAPLPPAPTAPLWGVVYWPDVVDGLLRDACPTVPLWAGGLGLVLPTPCILIGCW